MSKASGAQNGDLLVPVLLGTLAAAAVGAAAATLPPTWLFAIVAALALLIPLVAARHYVRAGLIVPSGPASLPTAGDNPALIENRALEADALAPARYAYFAGMLTIGQTSVRPIAGLTVSDWLFFVALCAAFVGLIVSRRTVTFRLPVLIMLGVALFAASGTLSSFHAVAPILSMARVARFGYLTIVWFWLGGVLLTSRRHLRLAVGMWTISIAIDGLAAIAQARGLSLPLAGQVMGGRMSGYTEQINDLGGAAAVAVAPALALVATASRLSRQLLWVLVLLGIVAALVLSGSVGGMAAGIGAVGVWFVVASKGVRPVLVAAAAIALAIGIAHVQGSLGLPTPAERVLAVTGVSEGGRYSTIATRVQGYEAAWTALGDGGWLGTGLDLGSAAVGGGFEVHNVFLLAWYEAGWGAAVGMACVLFGGLAAALRATRLADGRNMRLLAAGIFSSVAGFIAIGFSVPVLHQRYGWVSVALALSCLAVARARHEASGPSPSLDG